MTTILNQSLPSANKTPGPTKREHAVNWAPAAAATTKIVWKDKVRKKNESSLYLRPRASSTDGKSIRVYLRIKRV